VAAPGAIEAIGVMTQPDGIEVRVWIAAVLATERPNGSEVFRRAD
jgi:hypothetical protein